MLFLPFLKRPVFCGAVLEHFSAVCPASFRRSVRSASLRGRIHRAARGGTCSARTDPPTVFALAPWAISLKNALVAAPPAFLSAARAQLPPPAVLAPSWVLVDASSHQILASAHSEQRVEPASLTKLMTSYLVF